MVKVTELSSESLAFYQRHNTSYRYSKLGGKTPLNALAATNFSLRFPDKTWHPGIA